MKQSKFLIPGIIMIGIVLRVPFTSIPPVLADIAQGFGVSVDSLGILTSIPLLMFAIFSNLAPKIAEKFGLERLFTLVLILMLMGSLMRIVNLPLLYLGTGLIGLAIAMINVLLPSLITVHFPLKIGFYTTIYTSAMGLAVAISSGLAVPLVRATSWQSLIILLSFLVFLALLVWLPNSRNNHYLQLGSAGEQVASLWTNKLALIMLVFGGIQSMLFYTEMTWLPTMAQTAGLSKDLAGLLAGYFSLISLPVSMLVPAFIGRSNRKQRQIIMGSFCSLSILGLILLFFPNASFGYWLLINTLLGLSVAALFPYLLTTFSLKTNSGQATARLSAMVQSGGYLLAAIGPTMFGYGFKVTGSWLPVVAILFLLTLVMTWALLYIEKHDKIA